MGEAAKALKHAHADMDVDKVHDMMDDIAEQQDVAKEISEAISNPVAFGQDFDDDELEAELNELEVRPFCLKILKNLNKSFHFLGRGGIRRTGRA